MAYTPLHGVGGAVLAAAFAAGRVRPAARWSPSRPSRTRTFPTVAFPNPEEPGAMDRLLALATATGADLAIANDPDADRCAVAIPGPDGGWRMLRGDEVGVLLADHLMRRGRDRARYATTIVSSSLLRRSAARPGACRTRETLTGFKWIVRAGEDLAFGYEEALGYCVAPDLVRDKDGITAALTGRRAGGRAEGAGCARSPTGSTSWPPSSACYATDQLSVRVDDLSEIDTRDGPHPRQDARPRCSTTR